MKNFIGLIKWGKLYKSWTYEIQLFAIIRNFADGITFFNLKINLDRYEGYHTPSFQIEFVFFNLYNHIWIYKNKHLCQ